MRALRSVTSPARGAALLLLVAALAAGCEENRDPATPDGALHTLRDAVLARDPAAVLAASSAGTRRILDALHQAAAAQARTIAQDYPEAHRTAARAAYTPGLLEAADGPALFALLVGPELAALEPTEGRRYGLSAVGEPSIEGDRATVTTRSGERVELVLEDGAWRATVFERPLQAHLDRLAEHQKTLDANLAVFKEIARRAEARAAREAAENGNGAAPPGGEPPPARAP